MEKKIEDSELGAITLRTSPRAKRYALKACNGQITATMPLDGDEKRMRAFIAENRQRLKELLRKSPARPLLSDTAEVQTASFRLHIYCCERENFHVCLEPQVLHMACPLFTDFADKRVQQLLGDLFERALRHEALRLLPARLSKLAAQHHFSYTGLKVNASKTHWGSCTSRRSINLSLSLMLLPWHLIDYVLLHELCHTVEMNHSDRFWALLDRATQGRALPLREELKGHQTLMVD